MLKFKEIKKKTLWCHKLWIWSARKNAVHFIVLTAILNTTISLGLK